MRSDSEITSLRPDSMSEPRGRQIAGTRVFPVGLGTARVAIEGRPSWEVGITVVMTAVDQGVTFIDTADAYCLSTAEEHGYGERLVGEARRRLGSDGDRLFIATKGGEIRPGDGSWQLDGRPQHLEAACRSSLSALGVDVIDLYQLHRPDPRVPVEESVGALAGLQEAGLIRAVGVCNVTLKELDRALSVARIASVQNALWPGKTGEDAIVGRCERDAMAYIAHSPFGGPGGARRLGASMRSAAHGRESSVHTHALRHLLELSSVIIPIPGTGDPEHVADLVAAGGADEGSGEAVASS